jgi:hypothetical protein
VLKPFGGGAIGGSLPTIFFAPEKPYSTFSAKTTSIERSLLLLQFRSQMAQSFIRQEMPIRFLDVDQCPSHREWNKAHLSKRL